MIVQKATAKHTNCQTIVKLQGQGYTFQRKDTSQSLGGTVENRMIFKRVTSPHQNGLGAESSDASENSGGILPQ